MTTPGSSSPWWSRGVPYLVSLAGGVLWALQFGAQGAVLAPWIAIVPLVFIVGAFEPRPAAGFGFLHGLLFWTVSLHWIVGTVEIYGGLPRILAWLALLLIAAYLALFSALFAGVGARIWRSRPVLALFALPAWWVTVEVLRSVGPLAFPWNLAAYSWIEVPGALAAAGLFGAWGVSYLVVLANVAVASILVGRRKILGVGTLLIVLIVLALAGRWSTRDSRLRATERVASPQAGATVRVVQPNIPNQVGFDAEVASAQYRRLLEISNRACDTSGSLLIWPESAAWPFQVGREAFFDQDLRALSDRGCPVLLNSTIEEGSQYFNSALLWQGDAVAGRYDKRHLVPFGEYVPLAGVLPFVDKLARNVGAYSAADEIQLLPWNDERLGVAICFEVTLPQSVAELSRAGATTLVTITNDAWYGDTAAPWQHLRAARFRAAENRRLLLRAAITGVSAVVAADGALISSLGVGGQGFLRAELSPVAAPVSPFARSPWRVPWLCAIISAFAIVARRRTAP